MTPPLMVSIDIIELVLNVEAAKQGAGESPPGSNAGPYPERVQAVTHNKKGDAWCASDVADTGTIALRSTGHAWPLPLTGGCQELADFAAKHGVLVETPQRGDLWLLWSETLKRFAHTGFVLTAPDAHHITVQAGNTVRPGQPGDVREGWLNWVRTEAVGPKDRFIRWTLLIKEA